MSNDRCPYCGASLYGTDDGEECAANCGYSVDGGTMTTPSREVMDGLQEEEDALRRREERIR